ncbi:MAG: hypothetical protein ACTSP9_04335 [Promethearchaeota archaeon]
MYQLNEKYKFVKKYVRKRQKNGKHPYRNAYIRPTRTQSRLRQDWNVP